MSHLDGKPYIDGGTVHAELWYPRNAGNPTEIRVGLVDVRAADDIVIRYDFDRDGWAVFQDESRETDWGFETVRELVEVAFIPAWLLAPSKTATIDNSSRLTSPGAWTEADHEKWEQIRAAADRSES
jgi:hypothetical protein